MFLVLYSVKISNESRKLLEKNKQLNITCNGNYRSTVPFCFKYIYFYIDRQEQPVDSIYGMIDVQLFYQTVLLGIFLHFTWTYGALLYRVYSTEVCYKSLTQYSLVI